MNSPELLTRAADAEVIAGGTITLLGEAPIAGGELAVNRALLPEGYAGVPPHLHERTTECFFVLGGRLEALAGERIVVLEEGDFLLVPAGTVHALAPAHGTHADFLSIATPTTERFAYYRLLDAVQRGDAQPQELGATGPRFDNRFVESAAWAGRPAA